MADKGVKIKELARELGVTSRVLIDRCRENGLDVQNSISRVPTHRLPTVRAWFAARASEENQRETG